MKLAVGIEVGDRVELVPAAVLERRRRDAEREWMPLDLESGPLDEAGGTGVVTNIQGVHLIGCLISHPLPSLLA